MKITYSSQTSASRGTLEDFPRSWVPTGVPFWTILWSRIRLWNKKKQTQNWILSTLERVFFYFHFFTMCSEMSKVAIFSSLPVRMFLVTILRDKRHPPLSGLLTKQYQKVVRLKFFLSNSVLSQAGFVSGGVGKEFFLCGSRENAAKAITCAIIRSVSSSEIWEGKGVGC